MKIYGQSPEHIEKRAQANRGKKRTPEQIEHIKAGVRAYWLNYVPKEATNNMVASQISVSQSEVKPFNLNEK